MATNTKLNEFRYQKEEVTDTDTNTLNISSSVDPTAIDTATSTTTLEKLNNKIRPIHQNTIKIIIKNQRTITKATHHIDILQQAIDDKNPPKGLKPNINPRVPGTKDFEFAHEWEENSLQCGINNCRILQRQWIKQKEHATTQLQMALNHAKTIEKLTTEEELEIENIRAQISESTLQDIKRKRPTKTASKSSVRLQAKGSKLRITPSNVAFNIEETATPSTSQTPQIRIDQPTLIPQPQRQRTVGSKDRNPQW